MDKTKIKNFAVWAREKLITDIKYKAGLLGITEGKIADELPQSTTDLKFYDIGTKEYAEVSGNEIKQREALVKAIKSKEKDCGKYTEAFDFVVEEVAYTWFNRLVAIHFMEVNDYLPSGVRVLSSESKGKIEPDLVTSPFDTDLEFTPFEQDKIIQLKDENKLDDLFRMLFIKQCNKLHEILPELFEKTDDYTELLLTLSFTDKDGVIYRLAHDIDEEDFDIEHLDKDGNPNGQVEVIGWMYQYYISKKHEEVVSVLDKKPISKDDIPAATQLFTTDWVVRYMVDNSLGKYWIERNPNSKLSEKLEYYINTKDEEVTYINEKVEPSELTFFDPCMGSGHILVYAFDVLMEIYRECGYTDRDAAQSIIENNLYGLDIDKRAYQLAYFALMMKARSYNRRILTRNISNNLAYIEESNNIDKFYCDNLTNNKEQNKIGEYLISVYKHAQEYGALQTVEQKDYDSFSEYLDTLQYGNIDLFTSTWLSTVCPLMHQLVRQAKIMSKKYTVVCTNPPYMNKFEGHLKDFIQNKFNDYKGDLFSAFMYHNFNYCQHNGYSAFMTPNVWMFIKSYEKLREYIINNKTISSLVQMAKGAFYREATVDVCAFVMINANNFCNGTYVRLETFKGDMNVQKQHYLEEIKNEDSLCVSRHPLKIFNEIEGKPFAYWISDKTRKAFKLNANIGEIAPPKQGMATADNNRFLRLWHEVDLDNIGFNIESLDEAKKSLKKWFPYNKGGSYRRWYGNREYVVNWEHDGQEIKSFKDENGKLRSRPQNLNYFFKPAITWSDTTSANFSGRYCEKGFIFDIKGSSGFPKEKDLKYIIGLLNSGVSQAFIKILNPTITTQVGDMSRIPVTLDVENRNEIEFLVDENIEESKNDWNSFETSWEFAKNPLIKWSEQLWDATAIGANMSYYYNGNPPAINSPIELSYYLLKGESNERFEKVKSNEEKLNRIFIDLYGLQNEIDSTVEDKDITIYKIYDDKKEIPDSMKKSKYSITKKDVIKDFISYAVGCIFGRYSLDVEGLVYAGSNWTYDNYKTFKPDKDNCVPITDEEYLEDDIVALFVNFVKLAFGEDSLDDNLLFISKALGNKGNTPKDTIRNYFLNDFIKDHIKKYQKRPIYWMFDSGKENGFKALVYMHRWNADTVGNVRVEYLHKIQRVYEKESIRMQEIIDSSKNNKEISDASKRKEKMQKQLKETKDYDAQIAHIALSQVDIDLDDGVKANYEKVQTAQDGKKMQILVKI